MKTKLGDGGYGSVFLVEEGGRQYAAKEFREEDEEVMHREWAMLRALEGVAFVPRAHSMKDYTVRMDLVEGENLLVLLREDVRDFEKFPMEFRIRIAIDVCRIMIDAQALGFTHQDLKPSNIMIDNDGRAWVIDWGLSSNVSLGYEPFWRKGTPNILAPELHAEIEGSEWGPRSDVYSFAATLHWMMCGKYLTHRGDMLACLNRSVRGELELQRTIHSPVLRLIERCSQLIAGNRPTFEEILPELEEILSELVCEKDAVA